MILKNHIKKLLRQGFTFEKILKELKTSENYTKEELSNFQNQKLEKIINHCYKNVPYYTDLFNGLNLKPEDIKTTEDLKKLPFTDKFIVKDNYDKFIAKNTNRLFCNSAHTSGSSGTPGKFLRDYYSINFENAVIWRLWNNVGGTGLKRINLRGDIIVPVSQQTPPFWKYNPAEKELLMSSYHLSESNAQAYLSEILSFRPEIFYAYPAAAYILAGFFKKAGINMKFKKIFTSSESLSPAHRNFIEEVFQCDICDWYGQAERVAGIGQCKNNTYHIAEDYSVVELLNVDTGQEIVGTHLHNYVMPLIKYKTGDIVVGSENKCSCGSNFRTIESIQGRYGDYLLTPGGAKVTVLNHVPRGVAGLVETQFIQENIGEVIINVTTNKEFNESNKNLLIKNTRAHTSPDMKIIINEVEEIPRGPNGKFISVINKLNFQNEAPANDCS